MSITIVNGASAPVTTYSDGPGNPTQGSLMFAISNYSWWYFQINSANDSTGVPGTHKVSAWYNTASDPATGSWTYYGDSPNLNTVPNNTATDPTGPLFRNGRSMGAYYWNNSGGTNKDICHMAAGVFMASGVPHDANATVGNLRIILGSTTLNWGVWGYFITNKFNYSDTNLFAAFAFGRDTNGHMHIGGNILTDQLDAAVMVSRDVDTSDSWTVGGGQATGTWSNGSAAITALTSETGMAVGYSMTGSTYGGTTFSTQQISSIDSGTQITLSKVTDSAGTNTGQSFGWSNFTCGTRTNIIADSGMTKECNAYGFVTLASGAMLMIYDQGNVAAPNLTQLAYIKDSGTIAAGFWRNGTQDGAVFATTVTIADNDWCSCGVSTTAIYCARWLSATTCQIRNYVVASNTWQAITTAPPTMTGKSIKVGGGVCLVSDGTDMWLLVIDATDAQVKYVKYTHGTTNINGTWGSWTNLAAVGSTAAFLTVAVGNGYVVATWSEKNADTTHYDTKVMTLSIGVHSLKATATDAPTTTDAVTAVKAGSAVSATAADSPLTTDNPVQHSSQPRTVADNPSTAAPDAITRTVALQRSTSDTPLTSDAVTRLLSAVRTAFDVTSVASVVTGIQVKAVTVADAPQSVDLINRQEASPRTITDSPHTTDAITRVYIGTHTVSDAPSNTDSISRILSANRILADTPSTTDSATELKTKEIIAFDSPNTGDTFTRTLLANRTMTSSVATSDSFSRIMSPQLRSLFDNPSSADNTTRTVTVFRTTHDASATIDTGTRMLLSNRALSDTLLSTDAIISNIHGSTVSADDNPLTTDSIVAVVTTFFVSPTVYLYGNVCTTAVFSGTSWSNFVAEGNVQTTVLLQAPSGSI